MVSVYEDKVFHKECVFLTVRIRIGSKNRRMVAAIPEEKRSPSLGLYVQAFGLELISLEN